MKKIIIFVILLGIAIYIFYQEYYKPGTFNAFLQKYPSSKYAQTVEYCLGIIFSMLGKTNSAVFRFNRVIELYEMEDLKPNSYYNIAKCYEESKEIKLALKYYKITAEKYPQTYYGDISKKRYEYLLLLGYKE